MNLDIKELEVLLHTVQGMSEHLTGKVKPYIRDSIALEAVAAWLKDKIAICKKDHGVQPQ